jgi:putative drug exporter of the RND superfamily
MTPLGFWHRLALAVMRRPVIAGGAVFAFLVLLGVPALNVTPGLPDHRVLPASASSRQAQEVIDANFARGEGNGIVVVSASSGTAPSDSSIAAYAASLSRLPDVARVDAGTGSYVDGTWVRAAGRGSDFITREGTWLSVVPSVEALSPAAEHLVDRVRSTSAPVPVLVGGASAQLVDTKQALFSRLPLALGLIGLVTFSVLFLFTGGLLVGLKGLVLNLLSLSATFGAMVWVFQEGHLSGPLGFTATGTLDTNMPILLFCVVFGLSMDYEVFLMSRIKEHYDLTGDNRGALVAGLDSTGRLVSAAAALLAVVFLAFATSGITFIKLLGIGTALAVIVDATLVRGVLVPAFMRLAGDANWWAPAPLRALHRRLGLSEASLSPDDAETGSGFEVASPPRAEPSPAHARR